MVNITKKEFADAFMADCEKRAIFCTYVQDISSLAVYRVNDRVQHFFAGHFRVYSVAGCF
jgi:hypothetical protein